MTWRSRLALPMLLGLLVATPAWAAVARPLPQVAPAAVSATGDIHDVRGPLPIPPWWRWLAWGGGLALAVGLGATVVWQIRRRRARPLTAEERALERLERARALAEAGQVHAYADAASDAVREYIEERFQVRAAHVTTEEFFDAIFGQQASPLGPHREALVKFLGACDLAKFACLPLPKEQMLALTRLACHFVSETAHPEPLPAPVSGAQPELARTP